MGRTKASVPHSLFALIIGINSYESKSIQPLRGAVADARAVATYLQDGLNVPQDQITILENESATRAAILGQLQHIATDPRIQRGDPILIFYAGHGSETAAPADWEAGGSNANIQLTLPYDAFCESEENIVAPIPDRTFGALLEAIAQEKGNNIVVVMDSCHSASGTRSLNHSSDLVRSLPLPSHFKLQENLDQDIWSSFPTNGGLRSHVLISACSSSGRAWEFNGRGAFTVGLLAFLESSQINTLRYCDIVMRMEIDSNQSPHCEGFNRERYIFTTKSPPPIEYFIPAYTRIEKNGLNGYILNGGAAHGVVCQDKFAIYDEADHPASTRSKGTLIVEKTNPFYSIMIPEGEHHIPIGPNSIAKRVEKGKRQPLRIYSGPGDKVFEILSLLEAKDRDFSNVDVIRLAHIFKESRQFFMELDHTASFPDITQCVQVDISELQRSRHQFPGAPTVELLPGSGSPVPCQKNSFTLRQGASYGLKLTNKSPYNLYVIVQYFDVSTLKSYTWYRPACSRSKLDVPLKDCGGSLAIGYGSGGSPPLDIPLSDKEGLGFLKITLSARPLDPLCDVESLCKKPYESLKFPWATIIKRIIHRPFKKQSALPSLQQPIQTFKIEKPPRPTIKPFALRSPVPFHGHNESVSLFDIDPRSPIEGLGWLKSIKMEDAPVCLARRFTYLSG